MYNLQLKNETLTNINYFSEYNSIDDSYQCIGFYIDSFVLNPSSNLFLPDAKSVINSEIVV